MANRPYTSDRWAAMTPRQREADLRLRATPAETQLNQLLALHPETRDKFKFQAHWRGYYLDFLFARAKLVVELDGAVHCTTSAKIADARRTVKLTKAGYRVIRFWNGELRQPEKVMARILNELLGPGRHGNSRVVEVMPSANVSASASMSVSMLTLDCLPAIPTRGRARSVKGVC